MRTITVVIDAASVADLLLNTDHAVPVMEAIIGRSLAAPEHIDVEVLSVLAWVEASRSDAEDVDARAALLSELPLQRCPLASLMRGAWERRRQLAVSSALYVELAEQRDLELVTRDPLMAAAYPRSILVA